MIVGNWVGSSLWNFIVAVLFEWRMLSLAFALFIIYLISLQVCCFFIFMDIILGDRKRPNHYIQNSSDTFSPSFSLGSVGRTISWSVQFVSYCHCNDHFPALSCMSIYIILQKYLLFYIKGKNKTKWIHT